MRERKESLVVERREIGRDGAGAGRAEHGFTLLEVLVALAITVALSVAVLAVFQTNSRVARAESSSTQMQQAVRAVHLEVARSLRVAGRGGLFQSTPAKRWPHLGAVIEVADNVTGAARTVAPAATSSPEAVEGTDVLTVRGVLDGSIYQSHDNDEDRSYFVLRDASGSATADPRSARGGEIHLCARSPAGFPQDLEPLREAIRSGSEEAIVLAAGAESGQYGVVKLDPGGSSTTSGVCSALDPDGGVRLAFVVQGDGGRADRYHELSPAAVGLPDAMTSVAYAAVLQEHRYYVREIREDPSDPASRLAPRFSRARLYPNTGAPWGTDAAERAASVAMDVADDLLDFQVSLGLDSSQGGGALEDGTAAGLPLQESEDGASDDWLFNSPDDDPRDPVWGRPGSGGLAAPWELARLFYVRVTTVGRTDRPVLKYEAPRLDRVENRIYDASDPDSPDSFDQRRYRRWLLTTTLDLRNL
ncbi:MAG: prepilin-type N-terminal cleavage/methylation domain-containing protein [Acidobacteriota bacterium]